MLGQAWLNARPFARYLAFMFMAGVIASYGVVDSNVILIVGAMAVSPDLLPITAMGVSIVGRRPRLGIEAFLTLALGLGVAGAAAALFAFGQHQLDLIPSGFDIHASSTALGGLTTSITRPLRSRSWPVSRACWRSRRGRARAWASQSP